jgi:hypothetical protein
VNESALNYFGRFETALEPLIRSNQRPDDKTLVYQLYESMHKELYKHLYEVFANPAVLQKDDTVSYDTVKTDIIDYERACDPVH